MTNDFSAPPFGLDAEGLAWVEATFERLSPEDRLRQLFVLRSVGTDPGTLAREQAFRPGGVTRVMGADLEAEQRILAAFDAAAPVPLTVSGDLEGSRMSLPAGTQFPNPIALAAVDDPEATRTICSLMAEEAHTAGFTWALTPQVDISAAFRSAIVATRGYGSDPGRIARHAPVQIASFQRAGIAATAKHFPGEGYDDRDQHLVTTVNPLSVEAWEETFGRIYRAAIEAGVMAVMSAHIAFPAFARALGAGGIEAYRPASISRILNEELLRAHLGFRGLIVSDATGMGGLTAWGPRARYLPEVIASGCDVILFAADPEADLGLLRAALDDGRLTPQRVDEAVRRVLAFKVALGLHRERRRDPAAARATEEKQAIADAITRRAPTLVKDVQKLLPLSAERHRRVLVVTPGIVEPFATRPFIVPELLRARGFEVTLFAPDMPIDPTAFDLMVYLFGEETLIARSHIYIDWLKLHGDLGKAMTRYWHDVPTVMISFGYPYHLYEAPRVPCYVNAWMTAEPMQRAVVDALLGDIPFNTRSPVDPFCGLEDARY